MSAYTKKKVIQLISSNKDLLLKLNKFKNLTHTSSDDEFIN